MNKPAQEIATKVENLPVAPSPLTILQGAIDKGIDAEQLSQLMDLQERYEANQARKAFAGAMADFQANCPTIRKTKRADRYVYAPMDEVLRTIRPHLDAAGLSIRFTTETTGLIITAICTVSHRDGHSEISQFAAPVDEDMRVNDTQKMGSANSYAKRYALMNALNLVASAEDDDGFLAGEQPETEDRKAEKAARKPQNPATKKQTAELQDYLDSGTLNIRDTKYIAANLERMTKTDAAGILTTLKIERTA